MNKPIISIDGPAASGKGTLSRNIASQLNYAHMDTGALYRAVGYEVLSEGGSINDNTLCVGAAARFKHAILEAADPSDILGNPALRYDDVGQAASKVAAIQQVRNILLDIQRTFAKRPGETKDGAVLDGRDIGTVICPDADIKLFVTASSEVRAERRTKELHLRGIDATYSAVLKDMKERDARDANRSVAPLKPATGAFTLDTSDLSQDEALEHALRIIRENMPI